MKREKLLELFNQMTLEEKIYQLVQLDGSFFSENAAITGPKAKLGINDDVIYNIGSVYNVFGGVEKIRKYKMII